MMAFRVYFSPSFLAVLTKYFELSLFIDENVFTVCILVTPVEIS